MIFFEPKGLKHFCHGPKTLARKRPLVAHIPAVLVSAMATIAVEGGTMRPGGNGSEDNTKSGDQEQGK